MAKRQLGLGKRAEAKRQKHSGTDGGNGKTIAKKVLKAAVAGAAVKALKTASDESEDPSTVTVPLWDEAEAGDPSQEMSGLWNTFLEGKRDNELILNGIVNESDSLVRSEADGKTKLTPEIYAVFGLALAQLAKFQGKDSEDEVDIKAVVESISDYFDNAIERIDYGLERFPGNALLQIAKAGTILDRIPLEFISQLDPSSKGSSLKPLLDEALKLYDQGFTAWEAGSGKLSILKDVTAWEALRSLDDLLEILRQYGDGEEVSKDHPLWELIDYNQDQKPASDLVSFFKDHAQSFADKVSEEAKHDSKKLAAKKHQLQRGALRRLGLVYLVEAEGLAADYAEQAFDENGKLLEKTVDSVAQLKTAAKSIAEKAVNLLTQAYNEEDPATWADLAEAELILADLYEDESPEQTKLYAKAEKALLRANNATHGHYDDILESLAK